MPHTNFLSKLFLRLKVFLRSQLLSVPPFSYFLIPFVKRSIWLKTRQILITRQYPKTTSIIIPNFCNNLHILHSDKTCHIVCSGSSIFESLDLIKDNDFVIGVNSSLALPISHNLYFLEAYSYNVSQNLTALTNLFRLSIQSAQPDTILLKNTFNNSIDYPLLLSHLPSSTHLSIIPDIVLPVLPLPLVPSSFDFLVQTILDESNIYLCQALLSVYTLIAFAYRSGFKNIVLHGHDMSGRHFYCHKSFRDFPIYSLVKPYISELVASSKSESLTYESDWYSKLHEPLLRSFRRHLSSAGVHLLSATSYGISGRSLPRYDV